MTCDNASANDTLINALAELLPAFPGGANRTRCFTHILNLVVKVILCQFDGAKEKANERLEGASHDLDDLVGDIEALEGDDDSDAGVWFGAVQRHFLLHCALNHGAGSKHVPNRAPH